MTNKGTKYIVSEPVDYYWGGEGMEVWGKECSDGHHTFTELYEHRFRLYLALVKIYDNYITPLGREVKCYKSKLHHDGTSFEGWFLLMMEATKHHFTEEPEVFQISYHLPIKYWNICNVMELERGKEWDGHTSDDVLERLLRL